MKRKIFVVAAVIISSQLRAQEDTTAKSLDEVVMTANKYPNKTSLTGKVLTVITREQLEKSGGKDLSQLLTEQAGIYVNGANSNPGKDKSIFLRGAGVAHTLITIDGVPVYDPSGIGGNFDIRNLAIENIERIEILKGSQSTLYGSDAIAGVINIITRKNESTPLKATGIMSYGSNNTFRTHLGLSGRSDNIDYTLNQSYFDSQGINEAVTTNNTEGDEDEYRNNNIHAVIGIQVAEYLRIQPYVRFSQSIGDLDQGAFLDERDYTFKQNSVQFGFRNEFSFSKTKLNVLYNYNNIKREYTDDSASQGGFYKFFRGEYRGSEHFADAYMHLQVNDKIKLAAGAEYRQSNSREEIFSDPAFGPNPHILSPDSLNQKQGAVYAAVNINTKKGFNVEAGNRLNLHSEYGAHYVFNVNPSYFLKQKLKFFLNLSSAYRTPSLYQLFSEYGNKDLQPESGLTVEGGLQYLPADKRISARITGFQRNVKNLIFFYTDTATFISRYINQDKQKDYGLEFELSAKIDNKTNLTAFYTYVTGKINTRTLTGKDTTYNNLIRRPKHSMGITVDRQFSDRLYVSTNVLAFGKRNDVYFDPVGFTSVYTTLKSYVLWDLYAEFGLLKRKLKLFVDIRNISNTDYTEVSGFNTLGFNGSGGVRFTL